MRVVVAPNAFKGSLSSVEAAEAIARGWRAAVRGSRLELVPLADGGDGTLEAVAACGRVKRVGMKVRDPLGRPVRSHYLILKDEPAAVDTSTVVDTSTAVVEMALASGLALLKPSERDPLKASTFGTGELIRHAMERGCRRVVVGIGGSATSDGGAGIARALGWRFLDGRGRELEPRGGNLGKTGSIDSSSVMPEVKKASVVIASDVKNPLLGPDGAARVYGPQKGASAGDVKLLESGLRRLAGVVKEQLGKDLAGRPGAGAAGGAGFGLMAFLGGRMVSGVDWMISLAGLEEKVRGADLVLTGEGRLDAQSLYGKAPLGVARVARRCGVPVVVFCGGVSEDEKKIYRRGFAAAVPIVNGPMPLEDAMKNAGALLERAAYRTGRVFGLRIGK